MPVRFNGMIMAAMIMPLLGLGACQSAPAPAPVLAAPVVAAPAARPAVRVCTAAAGGSVQDDGGRPCARAEGGAVPAVCRHAGGNDAGWDDAGWGDGGGHCAAARPAKPGGLSPGGAATAPRAGHRRRAHGSFLRA